MIAHDRRGWGGSEAPPSYTRTTVTEQAQDALALADALGIGRAVFCGIGIGAVAALDLAVREPGRVRGAVLVEPPLLALLPEATEGLSADAKALGEAAERGGISAAAELFATGGLEHIGPGAARAAAREERSAGAHEAAPLPAAAGETGGPPDARADSPPTSPAERSPLALFAEIAAVPGWPLPLSELSDLAVPVSIVTAGSTVPTLRLAADRLAARIPTANQVEFEEWDPLAGPELAEVVSETL